MVFGSREMVSGHRSMVLPGSDMPSALGLVRAVSALDVESSAVPACVFLSFTTSVCCIKQSTQVFLLSGCVED